MSPDDLAAILSGAKAITPGAWRVDMLTEHDGSMALCLRGLRREDVAFALAARQQVPALVAEVRRLEAALAAARALCGEAADELAQCRGDNAESDAAISGVESRLRAEAAKGGEVRGG